MLHNQQPVEILKDMNAAMLQWTQLVPEYRTSPFGLIWTQGLRFLTLPRCTVKWSPGMEDLAFANQSTTIYLTYSLIQILVHRNFLPPSLARLRALGDAPSAGSTSAHTMTSLAIAVNAAKAGARFLHVLRVRGLSNIPILLTASELCAAVLCLDVWVLKAREKARRMQGMQPSLAAGHAIEALMADVHSLIEGLEWAVPRWPNAEDTLCVLSVPPFCFPACLAGTRCCRGRG